MLFGKLLLAAAFLFPGNDVHVRLFPFHYKTVHVTVTDAETKEPIRDAKVEISYPGDYYFYEPETTFANTDNKGTATLRVAQGTSHWRISLAGDGYFQAGPINSENAKISNQLTLQLIQIPKVTLIVPTGYVGPIKINLPKEASSSQEPIPHRDYVFRANANGDVKIEGIESSEKLSVLTDVLMRSKFSANYEDGKPIPVELSNEVKDATIALRRIGTDVFSSEVTSTKENTKTRTTFYVMAASKNPEIYYYSANLSPIYRSVFE